MSTQAPSNTTNAPSLSASAGTPPEAPKHGQDESQGWSAPRWPLLAALVLDLCAVGVYLMNLGSASHPRTSGLLSTSTQWPAIVQVLLTWLVFGILWLLIMSLGVPWLKKAPSSNSMASFLKRISKFEATRWLLASYGMLAVLGILAALLLNKLTPVTFALTIVVIGVTLYAFFWRPSAPDTEEPEVPAGRPKPTPPVPVVPPPRPDKHPLGAGEITIGRIGQPGGDSIILPHPQVSGTHARLIKEDGTYRIVDPGSTYHVYVNGQRVVDQALNPNDEIRIGPFKFLYTGAELLQYDESKGVRIDAYNLQKFGQGGAVKGGRDRVLYLLRRIQYTFAKGLYSIRNKGGSRSTPLHTFIKRLQKVLHASDVVLLNDISFTIPAGSLVALLGGSGAGKSTLMDALNGFRRADEGMVLYNGEDYYKTQAAFRTLIGYVPQEDIVHRDLTVDRALYYAAKMRLPKDFTEQQILQRIGEVLQEVQMAEHRSKLINKLSGGQRKRVSIALELLIQPTIFFLDEPTSGLDPGLDAEVMQILWELSHKREQGHTVVLVTHSVSDISYCDYVCFLAPGGYLAYFGPLKDMLAHFEKYFGEPVPLAEIYSRLEPTQQHPDAPKKAAAYFKQSAKNAQSPQMASVPWETKRPKPSHRRRQFWLLTRRYLELLRNDRGNLAILLLQAPVIGLLLMLFVAGISTNNFAPKSTGGVDPKNVIQCPTTAAVLTPAGYPDLPTPYTPAVSRSCQQVETFLKDNPRGKAYAATKKGGAREAVQDFLVPGPGNAPTILFIMAFSAVMFGCLNAVREIVKEVAIYRRERAVNLGILPYMFSKITVLSLLCLLQSAILVGCVSLLDPFLHSIFLPPWWEVYITIALTSLAGLMMGLAVSALVPNNDRATSIIPLILIPQVIFSGVIFPLTTWFLQYPGIFFPIRWAMAALGSSAGLHSDKLSGDKLFGGNYTYHSTLFSTYSQADAMQYLLLMWLALGIMIIAFGIATGWFLKRKDTYK